MDQLKLYTSDFIDKNIKRIAEMFPNCVTESRGDKWSIKKSIDFDLLRQELSENIVEGPQERYSLNWSGKREALLTANTPIVKILRPCREESVDFDTTENLFIEGDNLDALKLMQETYLGKIKMIYIDPPYNTGNNFIYKDNFTHSDWLTMMYPRLKLARDLLSEDGFIFISIGDKEIANLKNVCDEIYGTQNFVACFLWKKKSTTLNVKNAQVSLQVDYQLCYKKSVSARLKQRIKAVEDREYPHHDNNGNYRTSVIERKNSGSYKRETMRFPILGYIPREGKRWQFGEKTAREYESKNRFIWDGEKILLKIYDFEDSDSFSAQPSLLDNYGTSYSGAKMANDELFGISELLDNPKPIELIQHFIDIVASDNDIIMDFFAGSSTTAHSVMQYNATTNKKIRFIMIQLPEECDKKSEAFKAGYKTIAEISKERIRRAGKKIKEENATTAPNLDIGFRVLKVDSSNMQDGAKCFQM